MTGPPEPADKQFGRYVVEGQLGRGSMGIVYRGRDPRIDRPVAIKVLSPSFSSDAASAAVTRKRFVNEGRVAGRLNHPNIVAVHDADEDPATGTAYLAMELVDGPDLRALLHLGIEPRRLVEILRDVAAALDHAHEHGVIHRDVKPGNVLIGSDGRAKLTDFGIARLPVSDLTVKGTFLGSPAYTSPEQVRGEPVTARTDVFSLAVMLYEGLTGRKPFTGGTLASRSRSITTEEPPKPSSLKPSLPKALDAILARGLAKDPADRPATATELVEAADAALVEAAQAATLPAALPSGGSRLQSRRWLAVAVVAAGSLLATALVAALIGGGEQDPLGVAGHRRRGPRKLPVPPPAASSPAEEAAAPQQPAPTAAPTSRADDARRSASGAGARGMGSATALPAAPPSVATEPPIDTTAGEQLPMTPEELRVELATWLPGTLVVSEGSAEIARLEAFDAVQKAFKPKRRFDASFPLPSGAHELRFTFTMDRRQPLTRTTSCESPGGSLTASIDIGRFGGSIDVRCGPTPADPPG